MRTHIQILAWIYLILGSLGVLFPIYLVLIGMMASGPPQEGLITFLGQIGVFTLYMWFPGLMMVFAGWGLLKRRQWGRVLGIGVSAVLLLLGFWAPSIYGLRFLLLGIYGLIVLLWPGPGAAREFS